MSVRWTMDRLPSGGWAGMVTLGPCATDVPGMDQIFRQGKDIKLVATSRTKAGALAKAAAFADKLAQNPLLAAALPPGTSQAVAVIAKLAKSAAAGKLESVAKKVVGKGAKRLFKALKKFW